MTSSRGLLVVMLGAAVAIGCKDPPGVATRDDIGGERYRAGETAPITPADESQRERAGHAIKTVFLIVMENHNWSQIRGNTSAPYINQTLVPMGAHAEQYHPGGVHPSEPNYVWFEAGDNLGITNDAPPEYNDRSTRMHLVTLLGAVGARWRSYQEGISGQGCPLSVEGLYDPKHNPMMYFDDVLPDCAANVRPYSELAADLAAGTVADYNFITPDLCHDMHNGCASGDNVKNGDDWLAAEIPKILASSAYTKSGAIFVTWDEGGGDETPIGMIVLSPFARSGYAGQLDYSHSSTLRTVQEIFAVQPFVRDAANARSLSDLFTTYP